MLKQTIPYLGPLDPRLENKAFRESLEYYTRDIFHPSSEQPRILVVGCEKSIDMKVLEEFFKGVITGINIDGKYIDKLNEEYADSDHTFVHGDARESRKLVGSGFDVVTVRNTSPTADGQEDIFKECYFATKEGGIIVSTCYTNHELPFLYEHIKEAGYRVNAAEHNRFANFSSQRGIFQIGTDCFIVVGVKKPKTRAARVWEWLNKDIF